MELIKKNLPGGLETRIAYDATDYINNAISEVLETLIDTLIIVMVVIFLFLGSLRSVFIPIVAIPLSLVGAVFLMQLFGFTINLLTLLAIVLSVGLVVDDAIVVVGKHRATSERGADPGAGCPAGRARACRPDNRHDHNPCNRIYPIGLQGGLTGSLFREFAFTLSGRWRFPGSWRLPCRR